MVPIVPGAAHGSQKKGRAAHGSQKHGRAAHGSQTMDGQRMAANNMKGQRMASRPWTTKAELGGAQLSHARLGAGTAVPRVTK